MNEVRALSDEAWNEFTATSPEGIDYVAEASVRGLMVAAFGMLYHEVKSTDGCCVSTRSTDYNRIEALGKVGRCHGQRSFLCHRKTNTALTGCPTTSKFANALV